MLILFRKSRNLAEGGDRAGTFISQKGAITSVLKKGVVFVVAALLAASPSVVAAEKNADAVSPIGSPKRLRLLTTQQYINTIQYFFGNDIRVDVKFAPLTRTDGLLVAGASVAGVSTAQVETYRKVASIVASQVLAPERRNTLLPCRPKSDKAADDVCASKFLGDVTQYLYREPLSPAHLAAFVDEAGKGANQLGDFYAGLQAALEGVLLSPNVLFVTDSEEVRAKNRDGRRLESFSLATRLSLFLWNAAPDATLRDAAQRGQLDSDKGRARIVDMMLASPRLEAGVRALFDDIFAFEDFEKLSKDPETYPYFVGEAAGDAREQTLRTVVDQLIVKNRDYRDLYTTRETFISPALAILYNVPAGPGWEAIEFPPDAHRAGILTHASFLALHSHPGRSSATARGKALRELILCQKVPPPPGNVDFSLVNDPDVTLRTARERLGVHQQNPVCAGCHKITDPMGLTLENFDGAGRYRSNENGVPIDVSGNLDGKQFTDVGGLSQAIHDHPALPRCLVRRTYSYATGGALSRDADPVLAELNKIFSTENYRLRALLRAIALCAPPLYMQFRVTGDGRLSATRQRQCLVGCRRRLWDHCGQRDQWPLRSAQRARLQSAGCGKHAHRRHVFRSSRFRTGRCCHRSIVLGI